MHVRGDDPTIVGYTEPELIAARWRVGRKVARTIYAMVGTEASDNDILIGLMDSPRIAHRLVVDHNEALPRVRAENEPNHERRGQET